MACPTPHDLPDAHAPSTPIALLELSIDEARRHLPLPPSSSHLVYPRSEVGRQCIKLVVQAVTREHGETGWGKVLAQLVYDPMGGRLGPRSHL